ncbi:hypothetical protein GYMLUDRAFT_587006 [Collybiopsis luxurians FD-317 M1]|uniref:Uncharacterized protein n=1 Tax=Collybiopsis luxurians FD-317 M1 TaxID=944289 RepID=A0A0D0CXR3_9AGAR|nr:hypothetical protein GYMLUDRAFT_587006 [Collybiopsis luxurians FD-317 M1]
MSIINIFIPSSSSTTSMSDIQINSSSTLPLSFPYLSTIRVPPPLELPEVPLRERRGFSEFITIIPRPELPMESMPMPARGQLEPRTGALPRRRRVSTAKPVVIQTIIESKDFDFTCPFEDSSDDDGNSL